MEADAVQRRIELQSAEDLTYLLANVRRAAAARLDEAFPAVAAADGDDELRDRIAALVNEVSLPLHLLNADTKEVGGGEGGKWRGGRQVGDEGGKLATRQG
ncbi:hypothetical protein CDD83_7345 [Cordyceps sp. RAO-2017]|nr:hypothetical protein CDD83_7345 [Cordyceps sp. RAO-2017]